MLPPFPPCPLHMPRPNWVWSELSPLSPLCRRISRQKLAHVRVNAINGGASTSERWRWMTGMMVYVRPPPQQTKVGFSPGVRWLALALALVLAATSKITSIINKIKHKSTQHTQLALSLQTADRPARRPPESAPVSRPALGFLQH